ncbi:DUF1353 domain-containing protein [Flectobacillus rivi]|uniref:DUF1353 domain-containing protein n=1 Tax=Flectobacillus rivi TaxID=2984209 RepID=A0ABT6Z0J8_9BACT|nr:DUF1353 domain-containing protein [Flectobacillus rivi]MDI9874647.1 DUF1353 domain-containing protein [Flectobacillus rivi]
MNDIVVRYLENVEKSDLWKLEKPVRFKVSQYGTIIIPQGYITDFASSPQILWWFVPPIGKYNRATLLHDFLYENRILGFNYSNREARKIADDTFLLIANQTDPKAKIKHYIMYLALRLFGGFRWIK